LSTRFFMHSTAEERRALDQLLTIPVDQPRTAFQAIKRLPQRPSRKHLKESLDHLEWLESLGQVRTELKDIAPPLIRDFAKQARTTDAGELKDFTPAKRYTLLLCLIQSTKARTRDAVAGTVVRRIATIHKRAKNELLERQLEQRERVDRLLGSLGEAIQIVVKERSDARLGQQVRTTLTNSGPIEQLQEEYSIAKNWTGNNYLPLLWRHYKSNRSVLSRAINLLRVTSANEDNSLMEGWSLVGERSNRRVDWIPVQAEALQFASARWRGLLRHPTDPTLIDRRQFEVCVLSYIGDHLQAGAQQGGMISMDELIQTPYGELSAPGLEELRKSFDTRQLLKAVDELDRFCALWKKELRADLLRLHAMAHTLINDAPLTSVQGEEGMCQTVVLSNAS
jgi:hypothetical protein